MVEFWNRKARKIAMQSYLKNQGIHPNLSLCELRLYMYIVYGLHNNVTAFGKTDRLERIKLFLLLFFLLRRANMKPI